MILFKKVTESDLSLLKSEVDLEAQPKPARGPEVPGQPHSGVGGDAALAEDDLVDPARRDADLPRQPVLAQTERLEELFEQDLAGMDVWKSGSFPHGTLEVMTVAPQPRHWSRGEYERMVEAGILGPEDRLELIEGEILTMSPQKSPHYTGVQLVSEALREAFQPLAAVVRVQGPLAVAEDSEPEPDVAVVEGAPRDFRDGHPRSALLVVEVADTSLLFDRGRKKALYAQAGVPEYWLLNLIEGTLEVYREPVAGEYRSAVTLRPGDSVRPAAAPGPEIAVADLMP